MSYWPFVVFLQISLLGMLVGGSVLVLARIKDVKKSYGETLAQLREARALIAVAAYAPVEAADSVQLSLRGYLEHYDVQVKVTPMIPMASQAHEIRH
jgi:hypothetical protein